MLKQVIDLSLIHLQVPTPTTFCNCENFSQHTDDPTYFFWHLEYWTVAVGGPYLPPLIWQISFHPYPAAVAQIAFATATMGLLYK